MNTAQAIQIIDAVMGDNWLDIEPDEDSILAAARHLWQEGSVNTLPGRYGRAVQEILGERCPEYNKLPNDALGG